MNASLISVTREEKNITSHFLELEKIQRTATLKYTKALSKRYLVEKNWIKISRDLKRSLGLNIGESP